MVQSRGDLDDLTTEAGSDAGTSFETRPTAELVELMNAGDAAVPEAVAGAAASIAEAVDAVSARMREGGRLIYVGAGSSGRIAAVDAAECESTFSAAAATVVALVAGGQNAAPLEQEAAEDDREAGVRDLSRLEVSPLDSVIGVSASGRTPYVLGALAAASEAGAFTACLVSVHDSELAELTDLEIAVVVGPEFLAGSTRLKAGTAQKLVLNTLSTLSMIRLGKTYGNLMVDVNATNDKLRARVRRIVRTATGASPDLVDGALEAANGNAKVAIVALLTGLEADSARARLEDAGGVVRLAVEARE